MSTQCKNVFGFEAKTVDSSIFTKTAAFFNPADDGAENSISTQMTEDGKETPLPDTPEQQNKAKVTQKIYTIKQKVIKHRKSEEKERTEDFPLKLNKVNNSDDDKMWARYKSLIPHQQINLRTEPNELNSKIYNSRKVSSEENDQSNALSISNSESDSTSQENMFVIRSQKNAKKVMKFNKIKAIHPIPFNSENDMESNDERDSPPKLGLLELKSSVSSPPEYLGDNDARASEHQEFKPLSAEIVRKIPIVKIAGLEQKNLNPSRITSANSTQRLPQIFSFNNNTNKDKKSELLNSLKSERCFEENSTKVGTPTAQPIQRILIPVDKFCTPDKKPRIRSALISETKPEIPTLDLKALISPTNVNMKFDFNRLPPKQTVSANNISDESDTANAKKLGRFKTQEMVVNKIFNPANHRKKVC